MSDHLVVGLEWMRRSGATNEMQRAWMMHDFAEAWTGDIPTPYKTADFKLMEMDMLAELSEKFGVSEWHLYHADIKRNDRDMAAAEDNTVHWSPCGDYGEGNESLKDIIEWRPMIDWPARQHVFLKTWRELF